MKMLSRSHSNAGDRLRRAKSTSSVHTTSSGHQRSSTSIDPFVTRQTAETAAVEAYQRAKQIEDAPLIQPYRPVPPKLQRRRSQATGRTEGSHFEDARLGRRRSTSKKDESHTSKHTRSQHHATEAPISEASEGERVVVRKRSVIPPSSSQKCSLYEPSSMAPSSRNERRKSQTAHTDGSPLPRYGAATGQRSSALEISTPRTSRLPTFSSSIVRSSDVEEEPAANAQTPRLPLPGSQTDEDVLTTKSDHCKQEVQPKRLKERKSFMLAPFQRRKITGNDKNSEDSYDKVLPPFNYADELLPPPLPPAHEVPVPTVAIGSMKKSRNFSDSLKGRFKKVFRKATRVPTIIPTQHIEATHLHYPELTPLTTPTIEPEKIDDPFTVIGGNNLPILAVPEIRANSASSQHSVGRESIARSRVTSWTNSTVAATCSTRDFTGQQDVADEQGRLKRSDSSSTLKKTRSFFGRPVRNKLRRASKQNLQSSDESAGLYSALQERMQPALTESHSEDAESQAEVRPPSALDSLPSRQRAQSAVSSGGSWPTRTIRSVTPDPGAYRLDIPSPVAEVLSPEYSMAMLPQANDHSGSTPRSQLHRRSAVKAPTPSKEQIARRIERSRNRWQSPLDELSPPAPGSTKHAMEENPYELRSLSRTLQHAVENDLPHHAKVGDRPALGRANVLSPSVYSRATDGESPRPDTPATQSGMVVTITGREVKSYTISPSKLDQPIERAIHASQDWKRWLSDEMNGWDGSSAPQDFTLPKDVLRGTTSGRHEAQSEQWTKSRIASSNDPRHGSVSPALDTPDILAAKSQRPRPSSRLSGYMNDRYPMVDTSRNSSDRSVGRRSRISSGAESRGASVDQSAKPATKPTKKASAEGTSLKTALGRQRVVSKTKSDALTGATESDATGTKLDSVNANPSNNAQALNATKAQKTKSTAAKRPRSAFDLRASYKPNTTSTAKPLEVHRRVHNSEETNILDNSTILNISAGPYAARISSTDNKENAQPASEPAGLPALSSSEWLAAGTGKKREARNLSSIHPAYRNRSASRYSPSRTATPTAASVGGAGSPGQRLVSSWLDGKRSKENSPAFV